MKKAMAVITMGVLAIGLAACGTATEPGDSKDSDKTIVIWHTESNPNTVAVMDEIIASFEKKHPGYTVTQESVAWGDTQVKMQAALASGDMPELIHVEPMFVKTLYDQGLIRPLDSVLKTMPDYDQKFVDFGKQEDGNVYGLVHAWSADYMTYRKDMYEKAGADPNGLKTWDEWRAQLLEVGAANPGVAPVLLTGAVSHNVQEDLYMLLGSNGGSFFNKKGAPTLNTPEMKETLEFWRSLKGTGALSPTWSSTTYPDSMALVANGEAASAFFVGRAVYTFEEKAPDLVAAGAFAQSKSKPVGPSGDDWLTQLDAEEYVAFKDADDSDMALEFLKFFYSNEQYVKYLASAPVQLLPARGDVFDMPEWQKLPSIEVWRDWVQNIRDIFDSGHALPMMISDSSNLDLPYISDLYGSTILMDMVKKVVDDGVEVDTAMKAAQQQAEELLAGRY